MTCDPPTWDKTGLMYQAKIDQLRVQVYASNEELGRAAARIAAHVLEDAIRSKGQIGRAHV